MRSPGVQHGQRRRPAMTIKTMDADDALLRKASFDHVHRLQGLHGHLTAAEIANGFLFDGVRIPLNQSPARHLQTATDAVLSFYQDSLPEKLLPDLV